MSPRSINLVRMEKFEGRKTSKTRIFGCKRTGKSSRVSGTEVLKPYREEERKVRER